MDEGFDSSNIQKENLRNDKCGKEKSSKRGGSEKDRHEKFVKDAENTPFDIAACKCPHPSECHTQAVERAVKIVTELASHRYRDTCVQVEFGGTWAHGRFREGVKVPEIEDTVENIVIRYKPECLDSLCRTTNFSKQEIRIMYQGFKQGCPSGVVNEDSFKEIFAQFFPQGDASQYAHYVYKTFKDFGQNGTLNFEQFLCLLSSLSRGSVMDKVKWIFDLYDINGDGYITKQEMTHIVSSIYDMLGTFTEPAVNEDSANEHVEKIFHQIDANHDGVITFDEFVDWVQKDENRANSLFMLDTVM